MLGAQMSRSEQRKAVKDREMGIAEIATYTLGETVEYPPYDATRTFYRNSGFRIYKRSATDNPGCPEEIWISKKV